MVAILKINLKKYFELTGSSQGFPQKEGLSFTTHIDKMCEFNSQLINWICEKVML